MADELETLIDAAEEAYLEGKFEEAIGLAKKVARMDAGNTSGLHILGCAAFAAGDRKLAKATLRKLAAICRRAAAGDEEEREFYAEILGTIGDDLVAQDAQAARFLLDEVGVETLAALEACAADELEHGTSKAAAPLLERLAVLKPNDAGVHYRLASMLALLNRKKPMLAVLARAIELDRACVGAPEDPAFKRFRKDPALLALCQPPPADPKIQELYAKLENDEWEDVVAMGDPLLAQPTDALAVLEAMNDALENLINAGEAGFEADQKRIAAQLTLLKRAGARSTVYEEFLVQAMKE